MGLKNAIADAVACIHRHIHQETERRERQIALLKERANASSEKIAAYERREKNLHDSRDFRAGAIDREAAAAHAAIQEKAEREIGEIVQQCDEQIANLYIDWEDERANHAAILAEIELQTV